MRTGFAPSALRRAGSAGWFGKVDRSVPYPDPNQKRMHNHICDSDGVGMGVSGTGVRLFGNGSYGWGAENTINTKDPFEVSVRFFHRNTSRISTAEWIVFVLLSKRLILKSFGL